MCKVNSTISVWVNTVESGCLQKEDTCVLYTSNVNGVVNGDNRVFVGVVVVVAMVENKVTPKRY